MQLRSHPTTCSAVGLAHYNGARDYCKGYVDIAADTANKVKVASAGAIAPLVLQLGSPLAVVQENAAAALWTLAANSDYKVKVAVAGAVPPLVLPLGSPYATVQENVAGVVWTYAANINNKVKIAAAGAIPPLV